jgi:hypothetical protein
VFGIGLIDQMRARPWKDAGGYWQKTWNRCYLQKGQDVPETASVAFYFRNGGSFYTLSSGHSDLPHANQFSGTADDAPL